MKDIARVLRPAAAVGIIDSIVPGATLARRLHERDVESARPVPVRSYRNEEWVEFVARRDSSRCRSPALEGPRVPGMGGADRTAPAVQREVEAMLKRFLTALKSGRRESSPFNIKNRNLTHVLHKPSAWR